MRSAARFMLESLRLMGLDAVRVVVDEKADISGPTVAIMSGLRQVGADYCLTLPCDMPFLKPKVADYLFGQAEGFEVATPMWPNGRLETLLTVLERKAGLEITETLCMLKRPRSDDIQRGARKTLLVSPMNEIKAVDPELEASSTSTPKKTSNNSKPAEPTGQSKKTCI